MLHNSPNISVEEQRSKPWHLIPESVGLNATPQPVFRVPIFQSLCLSPSAFSPSVYSSAHHYINLKSMLFCLHFLLSFSVPQFLFHNLFFKCLCHAKIFFGLDSVSLCLCPLVSVCLSLPTCLCLSYMADSCLRAWRPLA